jgi:hypothetical protein
MDTVKSRPSLFFKNKSKSILLSFSAFVFPAESGRGPGAWGDRLEERLSHLRPPFPCVRRATPTLLYIFAHF